MMDLAHPHAAVSSTVDGDVLVVLARISHPLTGRGIARLVPHRSVAGVADALERLTRQGLVRRFEVPPALAHTLNRDHLAAPAVEILAEMRVKLLDLLAEDLAEWQTAPVHASMFGSAARGDGDAESDIDLLIVRPSDVDPDEPAWDTQLAGLSELVFDSTGNRASIVDLGESELEEMLTLKQPIVDELRRDAIDLAGMPLRELLREAS
jgi:predicted nucleotidyltransferase